MNLVLVSHSLAVCRLSPHEDIPAWALQQHSFLSITYTDDELSIVCFASSVPTGIQCEKYWQAIQVQGPLDLSLTGVLSSLAAPLAAESIPIFVMSTFDADYILVKEQNVEHAKTVLERHGHVFVPTEQQA